MTGIVLYSGDGYTTVEHNIPDKEVKSRLKVWRDQKLPAFTFAQRAQHKHADAETCPECGRIIEDIIRG